MAKKEGVKKTTRVENFESLQKCVLTGGELQQDLGLEGV